MGKTLLSCIIAASLLVPGLSEAHRSEGPFRAHSDVQPDHSAYSTDSLKNRFETFTTWCGPEKLYLHIDRTCYTVGESLWFAGWLGNATPGSMFSESKFIYAELIDQSGACRQRVKIKRTGPNFPGCIELLDDLETGEYTLRAYTLWQMNGDPAYMFNQRIRILGAQKDENSEKPQQEDGIQLSLWPEGGRYFAECKSTIAFKATDRLGRSADFKGWLSNSDGEVMMPVSTRHDGMGAFEFVPEKGKSYQLVSSSGSVYPLPEISTSGAAVNLRKIRGSVYASVRGFGGGEGVLLVRDLEEIRPLSRVAFDGRLRTMKAEAGMFRPGINHLILTDSNGAILAERLFFIFEEDSTVPECRVSTGNMSPAPRALINSRLTLKSPDGTPLNGECSVSVVRGSLKKYIQDDSSVSYMQLSSELKGHINNPRYYFDRSVPEKERSDNMDLLMMIQGWRYYDLDKILDPDGGPFEIRHTKEYMQSVRGRIHRRISKKTPKKFTFALFVPKLNAKTILGVDKADSFLIDSLDFEENTEFLINIGSSRFGVSYLPKWDGDSFAPQYAYLPAPGKSGFVEESKENIPLVNDSVMADTLQAAVVTAGKNEWESELVFGQNVTSDIRMYKDRTLVEYLSMRMPVFSYDGENMYNRNARRGGFEASGSEDEEDAETGWTDNDSGAVSLIVDDSRQEWWAYDMIHMEDIANISISSEPDPIYGGEGGVVMIKLRSGVSMSSTQRDPSLLYFVPLGYQIPRYFSSPRYDRGDKGAFDKRNTIYWSPSVQIRNGSATISFCNTDQMDYPYIVRIEGRTVSGHYFSHDCTLDFTE